MGRCSCNWKDRLCSIVLVQSLLACGFFGYQFAKFANTDTQQLFQSAPRIINTDHSVTAAVSCLWFYWCLTCSGSMLGLSGYSIANFRNRVPRVRVWTRRFQVDSRSMDLDSLTALFEGVVPIFSSSWPKYKFDRYTLRFWYKWSAGL